jgi:hypothetical protein
MRVKSSDSQLTGKKSSENLRAMSIPDSASTLEEVCRDDFEMNMKFKREAENFVGIAELWDVRRANFSQEIGRFIPEIVHPTESRKLPPNLTYWPLDKPPNFEKKYLLGTLGALRNVSIVESEGRIGFIPIAGTNLRLPSQGAWENRLGQCSIELKQVIELGGWKNIIVGSFDLKMHFFRVNLKTGKWCEISGELNPEPRVGGVNWKRYTFINPEDLVLVRGYHNDLKGIEKFPGEMGGGLMLIGSYLSKHKGDLETSGAQGVPDLIKILCLVSSLDILPYKVPPEYKPKEPIMKLLKGTGSNFEWPMDKNSKMITQALIEHPQCIQDICGKYIMDDIVTKACAEACHSFGLKYPVSDRIGSGMGTWSIGGQMGLNFVDLWTLVFKRHLLGKTNVIDSEVQLRMIRVEMLKHESVFPFFPAIYTD